MSNGTGLQGNICDHETHQNMLKFNRKI